MPKMVLDQNIKQQQQQKSNIKILLKAEFPTRDF